ncbi:MAG: hypothetical protein P9M13_08000 [Candidatus Ancaeobacter aquaticus]|nr:hypothetical protein [Candidatus Ancaeobacter aquaticus]
MGQNAVLSKELLIVIKNEIGGLAKIASLVAGKGINIEAIAGYKKDNTSDAEVIIVTDNNDAASETLKAAGYDAISEKEVVIVDLENKTGILQEFCETLAQNGIDLQHVSGTTAGSASSSRLVLSTNDNAKALNVLQG